MKIRFGQARERKQLQWRESFNVFSGVGFRCGSKRGEKRTWSQWCHTRSARSSFANKFQLAQLAVEALVPLQIGYGVGGEEGTQVLDFKIAEEQ